MRPLLKIIVGLLPVALLAGCASGYHCYPCGRVSCHYCPPAPLPSVAFNSCNCRDSKGQRYLATTALEPDHRFAPQIAENPGNQRIMTAKSEIKLGDMGLRSRQEPQSDGIMTKHCLDSSTVN